MSRQSTTMLTASGFMAVFLCSVSAHAASFDCKKATRPLDKIICLDSELSLLDEEMAGIYRSGLAYFRGSVRADFVQQQRDWIRARDLACPVGAADLGNRISFDQRASCLRSEYAARIEVLSVRLEDDAETADSPPPPPQPPQRERVEQPPVLPRLSEPRTATAVPPPAPSRPPQGTGVPPAASTAPTQRVPPAGSPGGVTASPPVAATPPAPKAPTPPAATNQPNDASGTLGALMLGAIGIAILHEMFSDPDADVPACAKPCTRAFRQEASRCWDAPKLIHRGTCEAVAKRTAAICVKQLC